MPSASGIAVVTGASGVIGSRLVPALAERGYTVRRLVRRTPQRPNDFEWNPAGGTIDARALEGADVVINLSGENLDSRWTAERKREIRESRVKSTALLATSLAALSRAPRVLYNAASIGIYGNRGDETLDETASHATDFLASVCADWEATTAPAAEAGIRVVLGRSALVLANDGGALAKMAPFFRLGLGGRFGNGRQWMSWIARRDAVRAIMFLVANETARGPVNVAAPNPVQNAEFTRTLGDVFRRPALFVVPAVALRIAFGERATAVVETSQRVRPKRLLELGFDFRYPTLEAALRNELGAGGT